MFGLFATFCLDYYSKLVFGVLFEMDLWIFVRNVFWIFSRNGVIVFYSKRIFGFSFESENRKESGLMGSDHCSEISQRFLEL